MSTCHVCFTVRSVSGACQCETPTAPVATVKMQVAAPAPTVIESDSMSMTEVMATARALLDEHGLEYVRLEWMRTTTKYGEMQYRRFIGPDMIRFSSVLFPHMTRKEQMNTITHEVAHALTWGIKPAHGPVWRAKHISLGGDGRTCSKAGADAKAALAAAAKWKGVCPNGHVAYRQAKSEKMYRVSCSKCSRAWNPEYKFTWTQQR